MARVRAGLLFPEAAPARHASGTQAPSVTQLPSHLVTQSPRHRPSNTVSLSNARFARRPPKGERPASGAAKRDDAHAAPTSPQLLSHSVTQSLAVQCCFFIKCEILPAQNEPCPPKPRRTGGEGGFPPFPPFSARRPRPAASPPRRAFSAISAVKAEQFPCQRHGKKVINIKVCT
jgi:hypothetical protein